MHPVSRRFPQKPAAIGHVESFAIDVKQFPGYALGRTLKRNQVQIIEGSQIAQFLREYILRCITVVANRHGLRHAE